MDFRPHVMIWTPMAPSTTEPGTGYEIPGAPLQSIAVPCRFHLGGTKLLQNEDSTEIQQKGSIRADVNSPMPDKWTEVIVKDAESGVVHFKGRIMDIFRGQLSWRLDV